MASTLALGDDARLLATEPSSCNARLRPYFVSRLGGMPIESAASLGSARCRHLVRALCAARTEVAASAEIASRILHTLVGSLPDPLQRRRALQLRRAAFNGKRYHPADREAVLSLLGDAEATLVREHLAKLDKIERAHAELLEAVEGETTVARSRVHALAADDDFQKALLISSPALLNAAERWRRTENGHRSAKDGQTERGLLRYLTRMAMKATPFARFCGVASGEFVTETWCDSAGVADGIAVFTADPRRKHSVVRLNKSLYGLLWERAKSLSTVRDSLPVECNATLSTSGEHYHLLSASDGREVFHQVARTAALDLVVRRVAAHGGASYAALLEALTADPAVDATIEQGRVFLDSLVRLGLIRFRAPVADQEVDWAAPLRGVLDVGADETSSTLASIIDDLDNIARRYQSADLEQRRALADRARAALVSAAPVIGTGHRAESLPYFEDATACAAVQIGIGAETAATLACLEQFVALTAPLTSQREAQATMRHFFERQYPSGSTVPLLTFYEDFYRLHHKDHLDRRARVRATVDPTSAGVALANPFGLESVQRARDVRTRIAALWRRKWQMAPAAEEIDLASAELAEIVGMLPPVGSECRSANLFCQLVPPMDDASARLVLRSGCYFVGYGKYFSRFLSLLPSELQRRVRADNSVLTADLLAEVVCDSHFNANLHPPLLNHEIRYPTSECAPADGQLLVTDLTVVPAADDPHALALRHELTGKRVLPVDLGFLTPLRRPALFQLLANFAPGGTFNLPIPDDPAPTGAPSTSAAGRAEPIPTVAPQVRYRPRLTYAGRLVLARRTWFVPDVCVPVPTVEESDGEYFGRLNLWREREGIPEEVYVRAVPSRSPSRQAPDKEGESRKKATAPKRNNSHKPQFIDFTSPLLVQLFHRIGRNRTDFRLAIEECYPGREQSPSFEGSHYVMELVLQVDVADATSPRA